ncbi:regulatory protein, luxR family [Denitrobacterium detoxificans]|uniref:Regulatory protein, luxR family n=3 Tax=Denitrobacterium detoxificans TaxID=79604 RepID=A0A1H8PG44_9ACTN|nr:regulatory protein, luxR family [Denitrobacterium detoxificans]
MNGTGRTRDYCIAMIGMAFFWVYFRHQAFFQALYPLATSAESGGHAMLYVAVMLVLLVLCALAIPLAPRIETLLRKHPVSVVAAGAAGSVGAWCAVASSGAAGVSALQVVSVPLVALGFFAACLAWARYFVRVFSARAITLLALSYVLSLVVLSCLGFNSQVRDAIAVASPLCAALCWYALPHPATGEAAGPALGLSAVIKKTDPYVLLFIAFLLAGSFVRGIVDLGGATDFRWPISIAMAVAVLAVCVLYQRGRFFQGAGEDPNDASNVEVMVLKCWVALALCFFLGAFAFLVAGPDFVGGQVVVVSRSTLDFFLWILLCNMVKRGKLPFVPVFVACSIFVEALSWIISYSLTPSLLLISGTKRLAASEMLVLVIVFVLLALIIAFLGVIVLRNAKKASAPALSFAAEAPVQVEAASDSAEQADSLSIAQAYHLTAREMEVAELFSRGHSIKKVAATLFISTSTAQSHIKSAYRKLGVHTRDELIEKLGNG